MLSFILAAGLILSAPPPTAATPHYRLTVDIDPDRHHIAVRGRLEARPCDATRRLYLNQGFHLTSFRIAGRETPVRVDSAAPPAQWTEVTRPLVFDCVPGPIEFAYEGTMADTIARVNLVAPGLVELAMYSGWYPYDPGLGAFTYEVELTLPAGWTVVTGGRVLSTRVAAGRQRTRFVATAPATDLAFVASPALVVRRARSGAAAVEVYAPAADSALADSAVARLGEALRLYGDWFGAARTGSLPTRLVYSPRQGWGYSRLPLIAVSADVARSWSRRPMGEARIFAGNAHELAHFWWQIADTKTNDWINEGLAEFSSFSAARALFGDAMRDTLLAGYRRDVARARTTTPIATTTSDSPDRYVNHYEKTALLFAAVERRVGQPALASFLRSFYAAHAGRRDATTAGFLADAGRALGGDVAGRLERCLTTPWTDDCGQ